MPTKTKDGETYQIVTVQELEGLGFFRKEKDPYSWFLYPSKSPVQTFNFTGFATKQKKSFDNLTHIHLITLDVDGELGLREMKLKSSSPTGGWWLKRKPGTGLFRLSGNPDKEDDYFRNDPFYEGKQKFFLPPAQGYKYERVPLLLAMLPATWLDPVKPIVKSAQALIDANPAPSGS